MGQKRPPKQMSLYRRVDEVLTYVWDPIAVREVPEARDEYRAYLPQVFKLVLNAEDSDEIADYLIEIESASMGYSATEATSAGAVKIAELLIEHRDWIEQVGPDR